LRHRRVSRGFRSRDAWIQHAALLLLLIGVALIALVFLYWWIRDRTSPEA
jgi:hypothetical protein